MTRLVILKGKCNWGKLTAPVAPLATQGNTNKKGLQELQPQTLSGTKGKTSAAKARFACGLSASEEGAGCVWQTLHSQCNNTLWLHSPSFQGWLWVLFLFFPFHIHSQLLGRLWRKQRGVWPFPWLSKDGQPVKSAAWCSPGTSESSSVPVPSLGTMPAPLTAPGHIQLTEPEKIHSPTPFQLLLIFSPDLYHGPVYCSRDWEASKGVGTTSERTGTRIFFPQNSFWEWNGNCDYKGILTHLLWNVYLRSSHSI